MQPGVTEIALQVKPLHVLSIYLCFSNEFIFISNPQLSCGGIITFIYRNKYPFKYLALEMQYSCGRRSMFLLAFAVFPSKFGFPFGVFLLGILWPLKTKCHITTAASSKELAKHRFYKMQNIKKKLADNPYYNLYYFLYNHDRIYISLISCYLAQVGL